MKEIALLGTTCRVFADVLGALLARGLTVNAMVDYPEKIMLDDERLTVTHADVTDPQNLENDLQGYADAVLTYNDDLRDVYTNDRTLKHFSSTVKAAHDAGVRRIIVVGSPQSQAFFVSDLKRVPDIDWVFISTEGDYPARAADEVAVPRFHREVYTEE